MDRAELLAMLPHMDPKVADAIRAQLGEMPKAPGRSKYGNVRCMGFNRSWDSLKERERAAIYNAACLAKQIPAWLAPKHGFLLTGGIWYEPDFILIHDLSAVTVVDVKGGQATKTKVYRLKKRLMLATYGITIQEV